MPSGSQDDFRPAPKRALDRRGFLAAGGAAGLLLCTIDGKTVAVKSPADVRRIDAAAARAKKPAAAKDPIDSAQFPTPQPQPGGQVREYWLQARSIQWDIVPTGQDEWMKKPIPRDTTMRAFVYQPMTAGFAEAAGPARVPGPTLIAEVGDTIVVHFRNNDKKLNQAVTVHPHGVRYNPEYDGAYLGDYTRAGGFVEPGEEFTYTWEATPDSVGVWPYHDHGPNHTLNTIRGLFGGIIIREKGAAWPDIDEILFLHSFPPQVTGIPRLLYCINGRAFAGNTPTIRAKVGQRVAMHAIGMDGDFHTFHIHGHRWRDPAGAFVDCPTLGPNETVTADFVEDNPGRWLYHCHVFSHQDGGMAGWYLVEP